MAEINGRPVCRALKTKMHYVTGFEEEHFRPSGTAHFWCLNTMNQVGPDDGLVVPERCCPGRGCFESDEG